MSTLKELEQEIFEAGVDGGQVTSEAIEKFGKRSVAFRRGLMCWTKAVALVLASPHDSAQHSFLELANFYARRYNIPADVWEEVSLWFDWDKINKELR
jgi:hypothetical protein